MKRWIQFAESLPNQRDKGYTYIHKLMKGFMRYVAEMDSSAVIHNPSFIKIGLGIQKLVGVEMEIAYSCFNFFKTKESRLNCLCGLVVRVPDYRSRCPRFDSRRYQIF
jgi:hypothetical protein